MAPKRYGEDRETRHTISANILEAIGRGLMLATAGLVLGAILGTSSAAARFGAGALVASGAIGAGCMIGSALVRNAGCRSHAREDEESSPSAELVGFLAVQPIVVEPESVEHEESQSGYVEWLREKRRESAKTGREI